MRPWVLLVGTLSFYSFAASGIVWYEGDSPHLGDLYYHFENLLTVIVIISVKLKEKNKLEKVCSLF